MESGQLYLSVRTTNFLIVILFYIAVASFFYRRLFRRLFASRPLDGRFHVGDSGSGDPCFLRSTESILKSWYRAPGI